MRLFGDNSRFGEESVVLTDKRVVETVVTEGESFPCGVAGLIPVISKRKKGGTKTVYAFPTAEGDAEELEQDEALAAIVDAVELANRLLAQAAELSGADLGQIFGVSMGVTDEGLGFTRVELVPIDAHNQPSDSPIHLHVETSENPGEEGSLSVVVELTPEGVPARAVITEFNEGGMQVRVNVNVNEKNGKFSVSKVEEIRNGNGRLVYKRGWTPKGAAYVTARKEGRETRGGKFVRETGRRVSSDEGMSGGRIEGNKHHRRFDDERDEHRGHGPRHEGRPARRDEVPGMRRIDGSAAKRGGTFPEGGRRDRDDFRSDRREGGRGERFERRDDYRSDRRDDFRSDRRDDFRSERRDDFRSDRRDNRDGFRPSGRGSEGRRSDNRGGRPSNGGFRGGSR